MEDVSVYSIRCEFRSIRQSTEVLSLLESHTEALNN